MKLLAATLSLFLLLEGSNGSCSIGEESDPRGKAKASDGYNDHIDCTAALRSQIKMEFEAALQYMLMGAHFAQDTINLGGFSKMFFEHANEERQHGIKFIEFLKMRGDDSADLGIDELAPILYKTTWRDGEEALRDALLMEKAVSKSVKDIIDICEPRGDLYSADWLTGNWLEEQLGGQRKLAGMINSLNSFRKSHEHLADWMFSNQLLNEA